MTPAPDSLVALRQAVSVSYDMRNGKTKKRISDAAYDALDPFDEQRKHWRWKADPNLLEDLVTAETAWTEQLWKQREEAA